MVILDNFFLKIKVRNDVFFNRMLFFGFRKKLKCIGVFFRFWMVYGSI